MANDVELHPGNLSNRLYAFKGILNQAVEIPDALRKNYKRLSSRGPEEFGALRKFYLWGPLPLRRIRNGEKKIHSFLWKSL